MQKLVTLRYAIAIDDGGRGWGMKGGGGKLECLGWKLSPTACYVPFPPL